MTRSPHAAHLDDLADWLARSRYAPTTAAAYLRRARDYAGWLDDHAPRYDAAFTDPDVRDWAARDYRRHLLVERRQAPATVALAMTAVGVWCTRAGVGRPRVPAVPVPPSEPRGLSADEVRRVLRAAEASSKRDHALVSVMFLAAVRVSECAALDVDDVFVSPRLGEVQVRYGKGGRPRRVPLPAAARGPVQAWLDARPSTGGSGVGAPLWLSRTGDRLSVRRMQSLVSDLGGSVGVDCSPHVLRHTYGRRFVEAGGDLTALSQVLGHASVRTTVGYARAGRGALAGLAERVAVDP